MRTLQEKYNAVVEGNFSKEQFRRDAAMQLPNLVSKFNSFEDMSTILKNRGMIAEAKKMQEPKYSTAKPEDAIAPDVLDTGIKFELDKKYGTLDVTDEQYAKCREMAIKNLANDVLYYVKQDSIQLETPGEKMEKVKLNEEIQNIENDEQTKKRIAGLTNQLLQDADPRDEYVKAYAVSVKRDLESGDASRMSQYKNILSLDDLKDDMEHYITHDVDQMEEGKSIELSAEDMEKLHKDGKITLPDGSVLHFVGKPANEEDEHQAYKDGVTQDSIDMAMKQAGMKEAQLKETIKKIIAKVITEEVNESIKEGEKVDLTKKLPKLAKPLMDIGKELDQKLKAAGFQTKIFMGKISVPREFFDVVKDNEVEAGIAFAQYTDGTGKKEVLDIATNGNKLKELEEVLKSFNIPAENGGKPQRWGPNLVQTTIRTSVD